MASTSSILSVEMLYLIKDFIISNKCIIFFYDSLHVESEQKVKNYTTFYEFVRENKVELTTWLRVVVASGLFFANGCTSISIHVKSHCVVNRCSISYAIPHTSHIILRSSGVRTWIIYISVALCYRLKGTPRVRRYIRRHRCRVHYSASVEKNEIMESCVGRDKAEKRSES